MIFPLRFLLTGLFAVLLLGFTPARAALVQEDAAEDLPRILQSRVVRIGLHDAAPLLFAREDGTAAGYAVDLLAEIAERRSWELEWVPGSWPECEQALQNGDIDLLFPVRRTPEREVNWNFVEVPLLITQGCLFTRGANEFEEFADLDGKRIGTLRGDFFQGAFRERALGEAVDYSEVESDDVESLFAALERGEIDAVATEEWSGIWYARGVGTPTSVAFGRARPSFAARTGDPLLSILEEELLELRNDPDASLESLREKWLASLDGPGSSRITIPLLLGLLGMLFFLGSFSLALRAQVARKTRQLRERNEELEREVEQRQAAQERALQSDERSRAIIENMPVMMNAIGEDGEFVAWNKECERVSGFKAEEIVGNPNALEVLYPDAEYRERMLQEAERLDYDYRDWERRYATRDGGERILSTSSISRRFPVPGWKAWGIAIDVTDRVRAQQSSARGEKRLRLITDALPVLIAYIDADGLYRFCNKTYETWFGLAPSEVIGNHVSEVLGEAVWRALQPQAERTLEGEQLSYEMYLADGPGKGRWVSAIHVPHYEMTPEGESRVDGFYSLMDDVTEQKDAERERTRLEAQLRQSQKMEAVGQLASGVAHDFRNLLTVISAHAERVKAEASDNQSVLDSLETMEKAVAQAATVTRSLLTFSRKLATVKVPLNLCQAVRDTARMLHRTMPASIEVEIDVACRPEPWINADETQLQQIVLNIALNARDAMPDGGTLRLRVSAHGTGPRQGADHANSARLVIEDTGVGMSAELLPRIFEPFFTTKSLDHGTGLGLATVHGIVEEHEATIDVQSAVGVGTTFVIEFPRIEAVEGEGESAPVRKAHVGAGEAILLAEDNDQIRQIVAATLVAGGYEVVRVADGEALSTAIVENGDRLRLFLMDVDLPRRSGIDVLREVRARGDQTPVLLMTANTEPSLHQEVSADPRTAILLKPFKMSELMARVSAVMRTGQVLESE